MTFKEDLEKLVQNAKPGKQITVVLTDSETEKYEGADLVVVGKFVRCPNEPP